MKNLIILGIVVLATCRTTQAGFFGMFSSAPEVEETTTKAPEESEDSSTETLTRYFENLETPFSYPAVPVYVSQPRVRSNPVSFYSEQPIFYYAPPTQAYEVVQRQQQIPITYANVVQQYQQPAPAFVRQTVPYAPFNQYTAPGPQPTVQSVERLIQSAPPQLYQEPPSAPFVRQPLPNVPFKEYSVPNAQPIRSVERTNLGTEQLPATPFKEYSVPNAQPIRSVERTNQGTEQLPPTSRFAPAPATPSQKYTVSSDTQGLDLPASKSTLDFQTGGYLTGTYTNPTFVAPSTSFGHAYDNSDGTRVAERGQVIQFGDGTETVVKTGQYEYIDPNGKTVTVKWIADDDGFRVIN